MTYLSYSSTRVFVVQVLAHPAKLKLPGNQQKPLVTSTHVYSTYVICMYNAKYVCRYAIYVYSRTNQLGLPKPYSSLKGLVLSNSFCLSVGFKSISMALLGKKIKSTLLPPQQHLFFMHLFWYHVLWDFWQSNPVSLQRWYSWSSHRFNCRGDNKSGKQSSIAQHSWVKSSKMFKVQRHYLCISKSSPFMPATSHRINCISKFMA